MCHKSAINRIFKTLRILLAKSFKVKNCYLEYLEYGMSQQKQEEKQHSFTN
jgi:hypothetical protein